MIEAVSAPALDPCLVRHVEPCQASADLVAVMRSLCDEMSAIALERYMDGDGLSVSA